jgi:DNA primase
MVAISFTEASERIKSSLDIVEVVQRHVILKKTGRSFTGKCPFHNDKSPSMNVNREKGIFKCFACGVGGDAFTFLMKIENRSFGELIRELADEQGIDIQREGRFDQGHDADEFARRKEARERLQKLMQLSAQFYQKNLSTLASSDPAKAALLKRYSDELDYEDVTEKFELGFAPAGWENLSSHLKQTCDFAQANPNLLMDAGLVSERDNGQGHYDRFRNRLIIPIHDDQNRIIAFGARSLSDEDKPKYLNSPETALYKKNQILYGLNQAKESIRQSRTAVVMEGYFDVISAHLAGITEAVGSCGTALTEQHLKLLSRFGVERIVLAFDSDAAGLKAALSAIELMTPYLDNPLGKGADLKLQVLTVPSGKDPDDYIREHGALAFRELMENAQSHWRFRCEMSIQGFNLNDAEARLEAVSRLTPEICAISRPTVREDMIQRYSERLGVSTEALLLEVRRFEKESQKHVSLLPKRAILETVPPLNSVTQSIPLNTPHNPLPAAWKQHQEVTEKTLLKLLLVSPDHFEQVRTWLVQAEVRDFFLNPYHQQILTTLLDDAEIANNPTSMLSIFNHQASESPELLYTFTELLFSAETFSDSLELAALTPAVLPERLQTLVDEQIVKLNNCNRQLQLFNLKAEALHNPDSEIMHTYAFHDQYNKSRLPTREQG